MLKSKLELINVYSFCFWAILVFRGLMNELFYPLWVLSISHLRSLAQPNFDSSPSTMIHLLIGLDTDLMACTGTRFNTLARASPLGF